MSIDDFCGVLGWCALINYALLLVWFVMFTSSHDWLRAMHARWFDLSDQTFDAIHYAMMGIYKLAIFLFLLVPYLVLRLRDFS